MRRMKSEPPPQTRPMPTLHKISTEPLSEPLVPTLLSSTMDFTTVSLPPPTLKWREYSENILLREYCIKENGNET
jgi:hypothetical protein